jgi:hypothetical protein
MDPIRVCSCDHSLPESDASHAAWAADRATLLQEVQILDRDEIIRLAYMIPHTMLLRMGFALV